MKLIHKAGLLHIQKERILLCIRKGPEGRLILPGGKIEEGETPEQCLLRELREELGKVKVAGLFRIGTYQHEATMPGRMIRIELFGGQLEGTPAPRAEIAGIVWFGEQDDRVRLAPSIRERILPDVISRGLLPWKR